MVVSVEIGRGRRSCRRRSTSRCVDRVRTASATGAGCWRRAVQADRVRSRVEIVPSSAPRTSRVRSGRRRARRPPVPASARPSGGSGDPRSGSRRPSRCGCARRPVPVPILPARLDRDSADRRPELVRRRDVVAAPQHEPAGHRVLGEMRVGPLVDRRGTRRSASPGGTPSPSARGRPRRSASGTARRGGTAAARASPGPARRASQASRRSKRPPPSLASERLRSARTGTARSRSRDPAR